MSHFKQGQEVKSIHFPDFKGSGAPHFKVGESGVEKITVVMECGQMARVPWFAVWKKGEIVSKWNANYLEGVGL